MKKGICVCLTGLGADDAARSLTINLIRKKCSAEFIDMKAIKRFGTAKIAADVCGLLARNGTIVVLTHPKVRPPEDQLTYSIDSRTEPEAAADTILKELVRLKYVPEGGALASLKDEQIKESLMVRYLLDD